MKLLEGKAVVVTGAGGGIGRDMALALAAAGARVVANDLGTSVSGEGRDAAPAQRLVQCALDSFGRIDAVVRSVHRSGGWTPQTIAEHALPALRPSFYPLDRSQDVFCWDPL